MCERSLNSLPERVRFLAVFLFVSFCAFSWHLNSSAVAKEPAAAKKPTGPDRFEPEIAAFEKWDHQNAVPRDAILFVGSSTVRLWQTKDAFPDLPVINRGFGGSTIADCNLFADRIVFKYQPKTIVFYAGDNDVAAGRSTENIVRDFKSFLQSVHDHLPETRLIFLSIKPSPARWKIWPLDQAVNAQIMRLLDKNPRDVYVDTSASILGPNGQPRKELFRADGLHMNDRGYANWNKLLQPILSRSSPLAPRPSSEQLP